MLLSAIVRYCAFLTAAPRSVAFGSALLLIIPLSPSASDQRSDDSRPAEMLVTDQGFIAIDSPKGWIRTAGPGLAYFVPPVAGTEQPSVWIYVSSAPVGPNEDTNDLQSYIQSDIAGFKQRFKGGFVQQEEILFLPKANVRAPVYTFKSGKRGML